MQQKPLIINENIMTPTKKQLEHMRQSVRIATRGSYEKQMAVLEKYPEELALARKLAKF